VETAREAGASVCNPSERALLDEAVAHVWSTAGAAQARHRRLAGDLGAARELADVHRELTHVVTEAELVVSTVGNGGASNPPAPGGHHVGDALAALRLAKSEVELLDRHGSPQ